MAFPTVALSDYLQQVADLLHTSSSQSYGYWGPAKLIRFINEGIRKRDIMTGGVRSLVPVALVAGTDTYTFTNTAGLSNAFDVMDIFLIYNNVRRALGQKTYTALTRDERCLTNFRQYPIAWCRYNATTVLFGPTPSQAFSTIWDVCTYQNALVAPADTDALPYPYTNCVQYWAAHLASIDQSQYAQADYFGGEFEKSYDAAVNARSGIVPNYYTMQRSG